MRRLTISVGLLALFSINVSRAAIIHVPGDSTTIQAGINGAASGDTVLVADGAYTGEGNRDLEFADISIVLRSEHGPESTLIDCAGDTTDFHRAFYFHTGENPRTIEGFGISGGWTDVGGAAYGETGCSLIFRQCIFAENTADSGGAIAVEDSCTLTLQDCVFRANMGILGSAIRASDYCLMEFTGCVFDSNSQYVVVYGWESNSAFLRDCIFTRNFGTSVSFFKFAVVRMENCTYHGNFNYCLTLFEADVSLTNCIMAFGATEPLLFFGPVSVSCCNIFGNVGGDWIGSLTFELWENGNVCYDPRFCDMAAGDLHLADRSPCAPEYSACGELIGALPVGCPASPPRVWQVRADGSGDLPTIQEAIDSCYPWHDTILVADGVYTGDGNRDLDFRGKGIVLMSEHGPKSSSIDCGGSADEPHRAFYFSNREDSLSIVDGFTIRGGYQSGAKVEESGGGILCVTSAPTIRNCIFVENSATNGGALACFSKAAPTLSFCLILDNAADLGGGVYCGDQSKPGITNCTFAGNAAAQYGSAILCVGYSLPRLENCIIAFGEQNPAVYCFQSQPPVLTSCDVYGNTGGDWVGCLAGQDSINGNISDDPLFCDAADGNFHLDTLSACTPANNPHGTLIGARGVGCSCLDQGDLDGDGNIGPVDVVHLIDYTLRGGKEPSVDPLCSALNRGDFNCDWRVNLIDVVMAANYVYRQPAPRPCDPHTP